jgi:hypothetical protein
LDITAAPTDDDDPALIATETFTISVGHNPFPWHNPELSADIDGDGEFVATDVLRMINWVNLVGIGALPEARPAGPDDSPRFFDADADGNVTPADVLFVVNFLNTHPAGGEGEGSPSVAEERPHSSRWWTRVAKNDAALSAFLTREFLPRSERASASTRQMDNLFHDSEWLLQWPSDRLLAFLEADALPTKSRRSGDSFAWPGFDARVELTESLLNDLAEDVQRPFKLRLS